MTESWNPSRRLASKGKVEDTYARFMARKRLCLQPQNAANYQQNTAAQDESSRNNNISNEQMEIASEAVLEPESIMNPPSSEAEILTEARIPQAVEEEDIDDILFSQLQISNEIPTVETNEIPTGEEDPMQDDSDSAIEYTMLDPNEPEDEEEESVEKEYYNSVYGITLAEAYNRALSLKVKHHLSTAAMDSILEFVRHLHPESLLPSKFDTLVQRIPSAPRFRLYSICSCKQKLSTNYYPNLAKFNKCTDSWKCPRCNTTNIVNETVYYCYIPVIPRLKMWLSVPAIAELFLYPYKRKVEENVMTDVMDGKVWKSMKKDYFLNPGCLAARLTTDGVGRKTLQKRELWPIVLNILNLPPNLRNTTKFTLLVSAVPPGHVSAVSFPVFLQPLLDEFVELDRGVSVNIPPCFRSETPAEQQNDFKMRCRLIMLTCDEPAERKCTGHKQHGHRLACFRCNLSGILFKTGEFGGTTYYPLSYFKQQKITQTELSDEDIFGDQQRWKINPFVQKFPGFRFDSMISFDLLHDVFRGLLQKGFSLMMGEKEKDKCDCEPGFKPTWVDSNKSPYSLTSDQKADAEDFCLVVQKPDVTNWPKHPATRFNFFSASEIKNFAFSFAKIYFRKLEAKPYELLVQMLDFAEMCLLQEVQPNHIKQMKDASTTLNEEWEKIFGTTNCTYKVHILNHFHRCVENFGPMRSYALYGMERYCRHVTQFTHGGRHYENQLAKAYQQEFAVNILEYADPKNSGLSAAQCTRQQEEAQRMYQVDKIIAFAVRPVELAFEEISLLCEYLAKESKDQEDATILDSQKKVFQVASRITIDQQKFRSLLDHPYDKEADLVERIKKLRGCYVQVFFDEICKETGKEIEVPYYGIVQYFIKCNNAWLARMKWWKYHDKKTPCPQIELDQFYTKPGGTFIKVEQIRRNVTIAQRDSTRFYWILPIAREL